MTLGFEVLVQLVIAAITTEPCSSCPTAGISATAAPADGRRRAPRKAAGAAFLAAACSVLSADWNPLLACFSDTRSCGRRGPARLGSTVPRSSSMHSE